MVLDRVRTVATRVSQARDAHGVTGMLRTAVERLRHWAYHAEDHHWWEVELASAPEVRPAPAGAEIRLLPQAEIEKASNLPMINFEAAGARYAAGGDNWVALNAADRAMFGVWCFPGKVPLHVGLSGWATLPADVVGIEDGATAPESRRSNVAISVLGRMADHYADNGMTSMVCKTAVGNRPVYMLLARVGYRRVGLMHSVFAGPVRFATFTEVEGPVGAAIEDELGGGLRGQARRVLARVTARGTAPSRPRVAEPAPRLTGTTASARPGADLASGRPAGD